MIQVIVNFIRSWLEAMNKTARSFQRACSTPLNRPLENRDTTDISSVSNDVEEDSVELKCVMSLKGEYLEYSVSGGPRTAIKAWCRVRNEENGLRSRNSTVVYSETLEGARGFPFMPKQFPLGKWRILWVSAAQDTYLAPYFVATDAHQPQEVWTARVDGTYGEPTGRFEQDYGYGIHYSTSDTTLGCIRVGQREALELFAEVAREVLARGGVATREVIA